MDEDTLSFEQLETICRLCLSDEGPMISLSSENFGFRKSYLRQIRQRPTSELCQKIFFLTTLQVSCDKMYFPTQICQKCNDLLQQFFVFKSRCLKNDAKIRDLVDDKERAFASKTMTDSPPAAPQPDDSCHDNPEDNSASSISQHKVQYLFCEPTIETYPAAATTSQVATVTAPRGRGRPTKQAPELPACSACNQTFKKKTLLDKHFNICASRDLSCQYCRQIFKSQKLLEKHVHNKHTDKSDYLCYFCGLVFNNSYKLLTHIRTHMPLDKVYNCDKCGKNFRKRQALINHLRTAHSESTYMCNVCGSQLSSLPGLKLHVRTIHTHRKVDRVLKCPLCPKMFARQQYVVRHMRSHTGETPYNCKYCERSFTLRWNHIQHERLHTGEKRYKCEICNKCFTHNVSKKNHMKYHKDVPGVNYVPPVKRKKQEAKE